MPQTIEGEAIEVTPFGRPPHAPDETTRGKVEYFARSGVPHYDIARVIGVSVPTLRKHYSEELETAGVIANAAIANSLYGKAISDTHPQAVTAAIFWLKTKAGWKETVVIDTPNDKGVIDWERYTPDERLALKMLLIKSLPKPADE